MRLHSKLGVMLAVSVFVGDLAYAAQSPYIPKIARRSPSAIDIELGIELQCAAAQLNVSAVFNPGGENFKIDTLEREGCDQGQITFERVKLTLLDGQSMEPDRDYAVFIHDASDPVYVLKNHLAVVGQGYGEVNQIYRNQPRQISATYSSSVNQSLPPTVRITNPISKATRDVTPNIVGYSGDEGQTAYFTLGERVRQNDVVTVTATNEAGIEMRATTKVDFKKPKNRDSSSLWGSLSWLASEGSKPTTKIDFKYDQRARFDSVTEWQRAWVIDAEFATATAEDKRTRKGSFSYLFSKRELLKNDDGGIRYGIGPVLELDDDLENRNLLLRFEVLPVINSLYSWADGTAYFQPRFGIDAGRNLGLKSKLNAVEDYDIARIWAGGVLSRTWKVNKSFARELTLSLDYVGRFLLTDETDTEGVPRALRETLGETQVVLRDGYYDFLTGSAALAISEYFSIVLKYENGESPMLYQNVNRIGAEFVYSY